MNAAHWMRCCLIGLSLAWLGGCAARGDITKPIPTQQVVAPGHAERVVVVLPGRGDDLGGLQLEHTAQIIQSEWPDADVVLTGLTMPFYTGGVASKRLHDEVIAPLKARGYRQIWLAGISLGGMGALLYDHDYPGDVDGLLLLSPYLGKDDVQREIRDAGSVAAWNPGPPEPVGPKTFTRELWRSIKQWSDNPARRNSGWLIYGEDERLRKPIELMTPQLPAAHVFMLPGYHNWDLWRPALHRILKAADKGSD
jgi:pimeloyl-ACP methyl ester carboxylesterase